MRNSGTAQLTVQSMAAVVTQSALAVLDQAHVTVIPVKLTRPPMFLPTSVNVTIPGMEPTA